MKAANTLSLRLTGSIAGIGLVLNGVSKKETQTRQKESRLRLVKFEADPFDKGTAQGDLSSGHAAEVSLGIACNIMQPIPRIFNE